MDNMIHLILAKRTEKNSMRGEDEGILVRVVIVQCCCGYKNIRDDISSHHFIHRLIPLVGIINVLNMDVLYRLK